MQRAEIQVVTVPVSDDDRAKDFSAGKLGWHVDHDHVVSAELRASGVDAKGVDEQAWGRFVTFTDPDGNGWTLQELPNRP